MVRSSGRDAAAPETKRARRNDGKEVSAQIRTKLDRYGNPASERIAGLARMHWTGNVDFNVKLVDQIYRDEIAEFDFSSGRLAELERSQYLERYLWAGLQDGKLTQSTSRGAFVLSILVLLVEKYKQRHVETWRLFVREGPQRGMKTLRELLSFALSNKPQFSLSERRVCILFLDCAFQSLEVEVVRKCVLPMASLPLWLSVSDARLRQEIANAPSMQKHLDFLRQKRSKRKAGSFDLSSQGLSVVMRDYFETLKTTDEANLADCGRVGFLERVAELAVDLLAQLPTRRFCHAYIDDVQFVVRSRVMLSKCTTSESPLRLSTFSRLVDMVEYYIKFEMNEQTGTQFSRNEVLVAQSDRARQLQLVAFEHFRNELRSLSLGSQRDVMSPEALENHLEVLTDEQLEHLCTLLGCRVDSAPKDRSLAVAAVVFRYGFRDNSLGQPKRQPLYPTETEIWDDSSVLDTNALRDEDAGFACIALPKMNLQFLTIYDYLLRCYTLYRLESAWQIREDLESAVRRLQPYVDDSGEVKINGWAKMAVQMHKLTVLDVSEPPLDSTTPRSVLCEVEYDLGQLTGVAAREWSQLSEFDVVFLVSIHNPRGAQVDSGDKAPFRTEFGIRSVRGIQVRAPLDISGNEIREWEAHAALQPKSGFRRFRGYLDPLQYWKDDLNPEGKQMYENPSYFNLLVRRDASENNFKAVLETIRQLLVLTSTNVDSAVPKWMHDVFLGYGEPGSASFEQMHPNRAEYTLDFGDTFVSVEHAVSSFPAAATCAGEINNTDKEARAGINFKAKVCEDGSVHFIPYSSNSIIRNRVRYTPAQARAIRSGMEEGLTLVVGPPGTGKTDVAVQIICNLYRSNPTQRTIIVTHSNHALNDVFDKILKREGVDESHLLRLGRGARHLGTDSSFSKIGRVNFMLRKRLSALDKVGRLAKSLSVAGDHGYTCETALLFYRNYVQPIWHNFVATCEQEQERERIPFFPFQEWLESEGVSVKFEVSSSRSHLQIAQDYFQIIESLIQDLETCRPFELIRSNRDRGNYILTSQARIVAMTCTFAAMHRQEFVSLEFRYDSLIMEEAGQMLEIESLIPMLLQEFREEDGGKSLRRCVLIGDHNQLPPVVKNPVVKTFANFDQSLFSRLIRLGNPVIELDKQGRARPSIAALYQWRYDNLGNLESLSDGSQPAFALSNPGFSYEFQFIDVGDVDSESQPIPFFYQNLAEAEYVAAVYQYMRLIGYPRERIVVLTTYKGQRHLLQDAISARVAWYPPLGMPSDICTVDNYQGRQNDYVLLSLVRTRNVGHLRDVRRLVVALSRGRLGLYVFGRVRLFSSVLELHPAMERLTKGRPGSLSLVLGESFDSNTRSADTCGSPTIVQSPAEMADHVKTIASSLTTL